MLLAIHVDCLNTTTTLLRDGEICVGSLLVTGVPVCVHTQLPVQLATSAYYMCVFLTLPKQCSIPLWCCYFFNKCAVLIRSLKQLIISLLI